MQGINQKYNRTGKIVGTAFVLLILLMSFMYKIDPPMLVPQEEEERTVAVLDFTNYTKGQYVPVCGECFWCKERRWAVDQ